MKGTIFNINWLKLPEKYIVQWDSETLMYCLFALDTYLFFAIVPAP